jgi:hypothetical protein
MNQEVLQSLISEDGFSHYKLRKLQLSTRQGCPLCRLFLLQDPNPDGNRLIWGPLKLHADIAVPGRGGKNLDRSIGVDISSIYFSSEPGIQLKLSVSAAFGTEES